jgi:hypothetical protein
LDPIHQDAINNKCSDAKRVEATLDMLLAKKSTQQMLVRRLQAKQLTMQTGKLSFQSARRVNMVLRQMEQQASHKVVYA